MRRYTLLIDADDTLWENNVFYEKLIEDFVTVVEPYGYTRAYIRHILNETERKNIRQYGYGVRSFGRSLEETYLKLADQMARREMLAQIHSRVMELERTPPKILDGVPETLAYLRSEEHTSELQSPCNLVCRLLLEKKNAKSHFHRPPASYSLCAGQDFQELFWLPGMPPGQNFLAVRSARHTSQLYSIPYLVCRLLL